MVSWDPLEVPRTCMCTPWGPNGGMFSKTKWSRSLSLRSSEVYGSSLRSYSTQENYTDTYTSLHDVVHPMWKCKKVGQEQPCFLPIHWIESGTAKDVLFVTEGCCCCYSVVPQNVSLKNMFRWQSNSIHSTGGFTTF